VNAVLHLRRFAVSYSRSLVAYAMSQSYGSPPRSRSGASAPTPNLRYIVELAAVIGLVGIGQTIAVIGGGIDLSVAAVITVTAHHSAVGCLSTVTRRASAPLPSRFSSPPRSAR